MITSVLGDVSTTIRRINSSMVIVLALKGMQNSTLRTYVVAQCLSFRIYIGDVSFDDISDRDD